MLRELPGRLLKPLGALALLVVILVLAGLAANHPPLLDPPGIATRLVTYFTRNSVETERFSPFPERRPTVYRLPPERVLEAALLEVRARGWEITRLDPQARRLEAVARTPLWGFADDVTLRVEGPESGPSRLLLRSASRTGRGDLGANTRRIIDLRAAIETRLQGG